MEIERRGRDPDTGEMFGEGFSDVFSKIIAKATGKTASKLASKAAEKLVEKGAEKIGEKTGQLVGEKIYDKFSTKPSEAGSDQREQRLPRNKRKRNWENACCFIPSCSKHCSTRFPKKNNDADQKGCVKNK